MLRCSPELTRQILRSKERMQWRTDERYYENGLHCEKIDMHANRATRMRIGISLERAASATIAKENTSDRSTQYSYNRRLKAMPPHRRMSSAATRYPFRSFKVWRECSFRNFLRRSVSCFRW
jgi:hypothetical protein